MSAGPSRPLRARSATEKSRRRDDILQAAERLWTAGVYTDLSMSQVAREARLAKGTLYLYFDTKEELFLALLTHHLRTWLQELHTLLQDRRPQQPAEITATLLQSIQGKENLRRLLLLLNTVLARRLSPETILNFRRDLRHPYESVLSLLPCRPATSRLILGHFYALSSGWQHVADDYSFPGDTSSNWVVEGAFPYDEQFKLALEAAITRLMEQDAQTETHA
ncbi:TetR/AcrR family transcriptional regulator [Deinococcus sp. VB343]|uniref:TetR/AcrR family transcriptional regulator n=1 Tax=Deinococcus sp. VB343 TaxID=3385567 RepID=UPI0039C9E7D9